MIRKRIATIHKWLGLTLMVFWLVQAATGLILTYTADLDYDAWPEPNGVEAEPDDFADAYLAAIDAYPDGFITRIMMPQAKSGVLDVYVTEPDGATKRVRVSSTSGAIIASESWTELDSDMPLLRITYLIHYELLSGPIGHILVGISGIFLGLTAVAGIYLGWPKGMQWRSVLKPTKWKRSIAAYYSWHRAIGLWVSSILLIVAITGAMLVWMPTIRTATNSVIVEPQITEDQPSTMSSERVAAALRLAQATLPQAEAYMLDPPSSTLNRYRVRMRQSGEMREFYGTTAVYIDSAATRVLDVYSPNDADFGFMLADSVYALHTGEFLGSVGRFIFFLNGLALIALSIIGSLLWYRKRPKAKRR